MGKELGSVEIGNYLENVSSVYHRRNSADGTLRTETWMPYLEKDGVCHVAQKHEKK